MPKKQKIIGVEPPYLEIERKYDLPDVATLKRLFAYVKRDSTEFVTYNDPHFLPPMPENHGLDFGIPLEITVPRQRVYFDTTDLDGFHNGIEFRQEEKDRFIKQVVKTTENLAFDQTTLVRAEHVCRLNKPGINLKGIAEKEERKRIKNILDGKDLKPMVCLTSQRIRFLYHPEGKDSQQIELAIDQVFGQNCHNFNWTFYQIELEVIAGPRKLKTINKLLDREEEKLNKKFPIVRNTKSKPSPGFIQLEIMDKKARAKLFSKLDDVAFQSFE